MTVDLAIQSRFLHINKKKQALRVGISNFFFLPNIQSHMNVTQYAYITPCKVYV